MVVNTAARVCFAGRGGQIVLSAEARDLMLAAQPAAVGFKDLGLHQLQGLPAPVSLFQVLADDLPSQFPPPRTRRDDAPG
jgi:class 3 adenylate cyclase